MTKLPEVMKLAAAEMTTSLARTRAALSHNLSKGEAAEESFRKFLRDRLPDSLGVTKGQIMDSRGQQSRQLDVIVYNKLRTPMLFSSAEGDQQVVPSEGVVSVIEVKTNLTSSMAEGIAKNMESVKTLDKSAYFESTDAAVVEHGFNLYGERLKVFPTLYFVFAFEGGDLSSLATKFRQVNDARRLRDRIDCVCILDRGVLINETIDGESQTFDGIPGPGSVLKAYVTDNALLLWYILFTRFALQADLSAINLNKYIAQDFRF